MKTGILTTKTIASEDIKDTKSIMGMSSKGMEMAQYFLRDKIYSDKILAVIREYISNAYDEHKKYGIARPVDVKLERIDGKMVWSVRDYAMGLNDHDIRNVFGMYFESTKSNENQSIGGFGIGGKAGFSYTDTFYVVSHHNGVKTSYVCTLGSGTKGIPVGEIYEIAQEPTDESGIEISLEIKDNYEFSNKTTKFVQFFTPSANIVFDNKYTGETYVPEQDLRNIVIGDYTFCQYENAPIHRYSNSTYFIRMGGVVYPHEHRQKKTRVFTNNVIVDVPIGKLTIPISRESIENTPLNDKVFEEIEKCLDSIQKDEIDVLVTPKFGELVTGISEKKGTYDGEWFSYNFRECFPMTSKFTTFVARKKNSLDHTYDVVGNPNNKTHLIYLFPNIKNTNNWHKRLQDALKKVQGNDYLGYAYMSQADYDNIKNSLDKTIDISDCTFVSIKSLKLPKLEKDKIDNEKYLTYEGYGYKKYYTAEELDELVRKRHFNDQELDDDWYLEVEDMNQLYKRTVAKVSDYGTRSNFWTVNSNKMLENLKELGWLTPDSQEYQDMKKKFDEKYRMERLIDQAKSELRMIYFRTNPSTRIVEIIKNKPDKIERLKKVRKAILAEDSTRARILKTFSDYTQYVNRNDLRKILTLKD